MRFVTETITPERADNLLATNENNRQISPNRVRAFARDMVSGNWRLNPQPIVLNNKGELKDGQHRLMAVSQSGMSTQFVVCYDADDETQSVIDRVRPRQFRDALKMEGRKAARQVAAASRNLLIFLNDYKNATEAVTESELREVVQDYALGFDWCSEAERRPTLARSSYFAVLIYAYSVFPKEVEDFHQAVQTGVNLTETHPALHLRNWMQFKFKLNKSGSQMDLDVMKRTASALEAYLTHRPMAKLSIGLSGTIKLKNCVKAQALRTPASQLVQIRRNGNVVNI